MISHTLYYWITKLKVTLDSETIKPVALAVVEVSVSQAVSQSVEKSVNYKLKKFCSNLMKAFWWKLIDIVKMLWGQFWGDIFDQNSSQFLMM